MGELFGIDAAANQSGSGRCSAAGAMFGVHGKCVAAGSGVEKCGFAEADVEGYAADGRLFAGALETDGLEGARTVLCKGSQGEGVVFAALGARNIAGLCLRGAGQPGSADEGWGG